MDAQQVEIVLSNGERNEPLKERFRRSRRKILVHALNVAASILGDDIITTALRRQILRVGRCSYPRSSRLYGGTWFTEPANLIVGTRCFSNRRCYFDLYDSVQIADDVVIGHGNTVITSEHRVGSASRRAGSVTGSPVVFRAGAWLGANVTVLPGVTIGVGAGAVVSRSVPPNHLAVGVPATASPIPTTDPGPRLPP